MNGLPFEIMVPFFEVKSAEDDKLIVEGYAATFYNRDRQGDIIDPHAFDESIQAYMQNPVLLAFHDKKRPIGLVKEAHIDEKGLYIVAEIPDTPDPHLAGIRKQIKDGVLRNFSIGGYFYRQKSANSYRLYKVDLTEISVVSVPANPLASFTVQKALELPLETKEIPAFEVSEPVAFHLQDEHNTFKVQVEVEGERTSDFVSYLTGVKTSGYKSFAFEIETKSIDELNQRLQQLEHIANRTNVTCYVKTSKEVDEHWKEGTQ